jgi:hypothetical protein
VGVAARGPLAAGDRVPLAGNALAKVAPGGGAMGSALQYRMLVAAGCRPPRGRRPDRLQLLIFSVVLALPCSRSRRSCAAASSTTCSTRAVVALVVFAIVFGVGALLLTSDRALVWVGRAVQAVRNRLRRRAEPVQDAAAAPDRRARPHPRHARAALEARAGGRARALGI